MKHYQTVDPLQKESQVGRGLFGIRVLILHFKFQFSKSVKSSTFHIFLNLTYPLRKNLSFPKHLKITQKFTQNCQIVDNVLSIGIWRRLKRDRDIGRKAVLSDVKTAFTFTPALKGLSLAQNVDDSPFTVDILIGADHYWDIVENEVVKGPGPTAAKSKIGYLLSAPLSNSNHLENLNTSILNVVTEHHQEQFDLERFWRIESVGVQPSSSEETVDFLKYYQDSSIMLEDGR